MLFLIASGVVTHNFLRFGTKGFLGYTAAFVDLVLRSVYFVRYRPTLTKAIFIHFSVWAVLTLRSLKDVVLEYQVQ